LIVVITIIAILATVAVIGYNKFIDRANETKADIELAQIENALRAEAVNSPKFEYNDVELTVTLEANTLKFEFSDEDEEAMAELLKKLLESIELDDFVGSLEIRKDESESKYNLVYKDKYSGAEATLENLEITVAILD
jgi:hypothetical protein